MALPLTLIVPEATASGNVVSLAITSSSTPRGGKSSGIPVGPVTGTFSSTRSEHGDGEADEILTQVTARLPNEHRLTITLGGFVADDEDETDAIELVQQIAKSVEYLPGKK